MSTWGGTSNTQYKGFFHKSNFNNKKAQTALALAVSLWIGGAGVAWADAVTTDTVISVDNSTTEYELTNDSGVTFTVKENGKVKNIRSTKSDNTITVESGGQVTSAGVGEYTDIGIVGGVNNNNINIAGTVEKAVYGGYAKTTTELSGNRITITGEVKSDVVGAYTDGAAINNHVVVKNGGKVNKYVIGGSACYESATENSATVNGGTVDQQVYGGYSEDKAADNNIVTISGGTIKGDAYGGRGKTGANNNEVEISGGTIGESDAYNVYGGFSENGAADNKNTVKITGGTINSQVYGGYGKTGANNNIVEISGGTMNSSVYGGYGDNADATATGNTVTISKGEIKGDVNGGFANSATGNKVNISGGKLNSVVYGGQGNTAVSGNEVTITGGELNSVYGGFGRIEGSTATGNTVTISGGTIGTTSGHGVYGGQASNGAADNNIVTISGGSFSGSVWGGNGKTATGNTVNISGGTFAADAFIHGGAANGAVTNNTVNILKLIAVGGLIGGESFSGGSSTGNTLNIAAKGVTSGYLGGFQNLNFYLPTDMSKTDTMLNVSGTANVDGAKVGVLAQGKLTNLVKNDKVTLLHANTLNGTVSQTTEIEVPKSIATVDTYEFNVTSDTNNIYATITNAPEESNNNGDNGGGSDSNNTKPHEDTKSIVETKAATTTFINAGADMLASQGFEQAANAVALETAEQSKGAGAGAPTVNGFTPFAAMGGSSMRAESGSYVDTKGFGLNLGFAREIANGQGRLLFGPLVEYGGGSYDSYLDNGTHGEGGSHYFGVGIMARQINKDGFYYEGSLRGGRVTSDYKSSLIMKNNAPNNINYDSTSNYLAVHVGVGKVYDMGHNDTLDGYLKYFYSHQAGDDVTIHATTGDEQWSFDAVNSHRIRIGARLTHKVNEKNSYYGGLAYQYEFGGDATAHYNGGSTPSPSVKGSSGMLELGWQVKPGNGPLTLDLGLNGWVGKQRGGSVQMGATWSF